MKNRVWQGLIVVGIVAIGAAIAFASRSSLFDTTSRSSPPLPTPSAPTDLLYPHLSLATPTSTTQPAASPTPTSTTQPAASPTPTSTETPIPQEPSGETDRSEATPAEPATGGEELATGESEVSFSSPTPSPEPTATPSATSSPTATATPSAVLPPATPTSVPTAVPPAPSPTSISLPTATGTATVVPSVTATASVIASASRTPTASPTAVGPYSFRVFPSGDFQVYRGSVAQIAGATPNSGIKVYLDGQTYHTPAGGQLSAGALLAVSQQRWLGENMHVTTFSGSGGLTVTQTISYTAGAGFLTLRWDISSAAHPDARFIYAFDSALEGNDLGDPYRDPQSGTVGVWYPGLRNRFMGLRPVSPTPSAYTLGNVDGPNGWAAVESSALKSFAGSGADNYLIALQWDNRLRNDTVWTVEVRLTFSPRLGRGERPFAPTIATSTPAPWRR